MNIALWIVQAWVAFNLLFQGIIKFFSATARDAPIAIPLDV